MRRWLAIGLVCLLVAGCARSLSGDRFRPATYTVRSGDTLYSIAWRYGLDHRDLMRWNDIGDARNLRVGRRLRLHPDRAAAAPSTTSTARTSATGRDADPSAGNRADPGAGTDSGSDSRGSGTSASRPEAEARKGTGEPPGRWRWPTRGTVIARFGDSRAGGRGVDIRGEAGQPVQATAAGDVVYSGDGLKAYGRLLIIRHEGDFLSAYAHNSELLVAEGDRVDAGQPIARMGRTRGGTSLLHFEIRRGGSPVDPFDYLPERQQ